MPHPSPANNGPIGLRAPASAPTTPAPIATPIPRHNAAAEAARRSVAQVDDPSQRVSSVHRASPESRVASRERFLCTRSLGTQGSGLGTRLRPQILKQELLLPS